jgi:hypothetical protein
VLTVLSVEIQRGDYSFRGEMARTCTPILNYGLDENELDWPNPFLAAASSPPNEILISYPY